MAAAVPQFPDLTNFLLDDLFEITGRNAPILINGHISNPGVPVSAAIGWCMTNGLLTTYKNCNCGRVMNLKATPVCKDAVRWKCNGKTCKTTASLRQGSFFEESNLTMSEILRIMYFWSEEIDKQDFMMRQVGIGSAHTVVDWKNFCRDICAEYFVANPVQIGGPGHVVEIDEALFAKRKYNRGRLVREQWVFGGIDRQTRECFMVEVGQRNAATLLPILQQYVLPGTTVMSDLWAAYNGIANLPQGYNHLTVNHSINFVDPITGACTNLQECNWKNAKMKNKRMCGTHRTLLHSYLIEYMWRCSFPNGSFHHLVNQIRNVYQL